MDPRDLWNYDHNATPLSPTGRILGEMLARYGAEEELRNLMNGHTFGSAVASARKQRRLTIKSLLATSASLRHFNELTWNEIEQDRLDPRSIADPALQAISTALNLTVDELKSLAAKHDQAFAEQSRLWSLLTIEAHAFRARRAVD